MTATLELKLNKNITESYLPFVPRINRLLSDSNLRKQDSNCWGTIAWVLGIEDQILEGFHKNHKQRKKPGFIDPRLIQYFLTFNSNISIVGEGNTGDIISFERHLDLQHGGIYLGETKKGKIMFHQRDDGVFEIIPLKKYKLDNEIRTIYYAF